MAVSDCQGFKHQLRVKQLKTGCIVLANDQLMECDRVDVIALRADDSSERLQAPRPR